MYQNSIKRIFDFFFSMMGLLVLSPLLVIIAIILVFLNNGKPFFFQIRPGKFERPFKLIKFKTMTDYKDESGNLLPEDQRVTAFGKFLRKTSLDELPELINILLGHMSIVGPRPLLMEYLPHYTEKEKIRHLVRPGLTGLAQVKGRNLLKWDEKLALDVEYVNKISFPLDIKLILQTFLVVLQPKKVLMYAPEGPLHKHRAKQKRNEDSGTKN